MTKKITSSEMGVLRRGRFFLLAFLFLSLSVPPSRAEYRVYQYYVKSRTPLAQDSSAYLSTSTLDPVSYLSYHGGSSSIDIDLLRTWICPGYTGQGQNICKGPYERILELKLKAQEAQEAQKKAKSGP